MTGTALAAWSRATFAMGLLWGISFAALADAYRYDVPPGWNVSRAQGMTALNPSDGSAAGIYVYPPVPAETDVEKQFERANLSFEQATEVVNPTVDIPLKRMTGEAGPTLLRSTHYAKGGGTVWALTAARVEDGVFAYVIYVGMDPAAFQKHLQEASGTLATLRLGQNSQGAQNAQGAQGAPPPPAPVPQESARRAPEKSDAAAPKGTGKVSRALAPSRDGASPVMADLVGTWVGNATREFSRPNINFNAPWNYGGYDVMLGWFENKLLTLGGGGALVRVRPDGSYTWLTVSNDHGCETTRVHEGRLVRASAASGSQLQFLPVRFTESVERAEGSKGGGKCDPRKTTTAPPLVYKHWRDKYSVEAFYLTEILQLENTLPGEGGIMTLHRLERTPLKSAPQNLTVGAGDFFQPAAVGPLPPELQGEYVAEELVKMGDRAVPRYRARLKLLPDGRYEFLAQVSNILRTSVCGKSVTLAETGTVGYGARSKTNDPRRAQLVFQPAASRVREAVTACGEEDGELEFDLPNLARYFKFDPTQGADPLRMTCPDDGYRGPMQAFFCPSEVSRLQPGFLHRR